MSLTRTLTVRLDEPGGGVTYVGESEPGTPAGTAAWRIKRLTEAGTALTIEFANGNQDFSDAWDQRASLTYT
jgi:hypothetical protein